MMRHLVRHGWRMLSAACVLSLALSALATMTAPTALAAGNTRQSAGFEQVREPEGNVDDFWVNTPWEEMTPEEQALWNVLGWNADNWDGESGLPQSELTLWADLSPEEQAAAAELGYDERAWNEVIIRQPAENVNDFWVDTPWEEMTTAEQAAWAALGWSADNWDGEGDLPVSERTLWADLSPEEQATAARFGYDEDTWKAVVIRKPVESVDDFWVNTPWEELTTAEQEAWTTLGWNADNWDGAGDLPVSETTLWADLTPEEQATASRFGYDEASWNAGLAKE